MSVDLWIGAATTLAGAFLGGVISYVLSRQQILEARQQRQEEWRVQSEQSRNDRRLSCYSDFITRARAYRSAMRSFSQGRLDQAEVVQADKLAADADTTSSLVFLVMESSVTYDACRAVLKAIRECQAYIHHDVGADSSNVAEFEGRLATSLREFQAAAREELEVTGIGRSRILGRPSEGLTSSSASGAA